MLLLAGKFLSSILIFSTRAAFTIIDYEVISLDFPPIGTPLHHNGNPEDFIGVQKSVKRETTSNDLIEPPAKRNANDFNSNGNGLNKENASNYTRNNSKVELTQISFITPYINK